jgi:broad specificity phosphatase PhoE
MARIYFITHPEVQFDWSVPVPQWDLSAVGRSRLEQLVQQPWVRSLHAVFASPERKSVTAAERIVQVKPAPLQYMPDLMEIDRTAAGTLPPEEYSAVTEAFFAKPQESARGWERAVDAQQRIVQAFEGILTQLPAASNAAIVSHGGVGTLLLCHLKASPIRRAEDQPRQGHYFTFDTIARRIEHGWRRIDALES